MSFYTAADDSAPTEKMRITSTGLVGIGTTSPTHKLTVAGAISGSSTIEAVGATTLGSTLNVSGNATFGIDDTGVDVRIYSATTNEGILYDASEDELGLLLTTKLKFHDIGGGEEIYASSNGHLEVNAGTTLDMTAPTVDVNASTAVTLDSPSVVIASSTASKPRLELKNTTDDTNSAILRFVKDKGSAGAANDNVGLIEFYGDDANQDQVLFGRIRTRVAVHTDGQEGGKMQFAVASHDGELVAGLTIGDGDAEDEIDVEIGSGAASLTTVAGLLTASAGISGFTGTFQGGLSVAGSTVIDEDMNYSGSGTMQVVGNTFVGGTLNVTGAADLRGGVTVNDGGADLDFRVESADESHMIFVEGSSNRMSIGDNTGSPGATLEVKNHASAGAYGVPLVQLNSNDTDEIALDINASNIDANVVDILASAVTTAKVINVSADGLTTGNAFRVDDNSAETDSRKTALIIQNNAAAIAATALHVQSDGGVTGMAIDKNFTDVAAATVRGLHVDFDRTVPGSGTATFTDIGIDLDVNAAGLGTTTTTGLDVDVVGATSGTHTAIGIAIDVDSADTNIGMLINTAGTHIKLEANADTDDYATIAVADTGDMTITTVGDGTTDSDLTLTVDGDIILGPAGGDVLPDSDNARNLGSGAKRWANIYTGDLHLKNERGDWTIVEEEDYLCVINNRTGKKYKMGLVPMEDDE